MKEQTVVMSGLLLALSFLPANSSAQGYTTYEEELQSDTAIIVVTGMEFSTEDQGYMSSGFSVAEGATVRIADENGNVREKRTEAFALSRRAPRTLYTADFLVKMGSMYKIVITFTDGTVICIDDYRLDPSWKRHHYFHSTDGNKSPASLLRKQKDEKSGRWCYVYSLFPIKNYIASGGTQVK